jgi:DNA-binding transcriptional regulator GbsR (MarR family)
MKDFKGLTKKDLFEHWNQTADGIGTAHKMVMAEVKKNNDETNNKIDELRKALEEQNRLLTPILELQKDLLGASKVFKFVFKFVITPGTIILGGIWTWINIMRNLHH